MIMSIYKCQLCAEEFDTLPQYPLHALWKYGDNRHIGCMERINGQPYPVIYPISEWNEKQYLFLQKRNVEIKEIIRKAFKLSY
jgi:hypothetical protein